jgi:hypothetical protein
MLSVTIELNHSSGLRAYSLQSDTASEMMGDVTRHAA